MIKSTRLPFVILAIVSLLAGLASGLSRMGWDMRMLDVSLHHGAIMVGGFLGTLISLEKVIPIRKRILFTVPLVSGSSVVLFFAGQPGASFVFLASASLMLSAVFLYYLVRTMDMIYFMMVCGGLCWLVGNVFLVSRHFYPAAFPWWMGFILFIITAERLELTKFLPVTRALKFTLVVLLFLFVGGIVLSFHARGGWISGFALAGIAIWLMKYDVVAITIRKNGLQKFIAIALLCGYVAMLLTGVFMISLTDHAFGYDAILHTFFLGFVFSMIFSHGPVILPGVLGVSAKPWHPVMYFWLFLLHSSLILRVVADLLLDMDLRKATGLGSTVAILGYFVTVAILTVRSLRPNEKVL